MITLTVLGVTLIAMRQAKPFAGRRTGSDGEVCIIIATEKRPPPWLLLLNDWRSIGEGIGSRGPIRRRVSKRWEAIRASIKRGRPFGSAWTQRMTDRLKLPRCIVGVEPKVD